VHSHNESSECQVVLWQGFFPHDVEDFLDVNEIINQLLHALIECRSVLVLGTFKNEFICCDLQMGS
jgi:hypothetical protein